MTAPPPMPNRPANSPVMTPPTMIANASQSSSCNGTPRIILLFALSTGAGLRGDVGQFPARVQIMVRDKRERRGEEFSAGLRRCRGTGEMPAVSACTGHCAEQAVQMPGDGVQPRAARDFTFDIKGERGSGLFRRVERSVLAEHLRI